MTQEAKKTQNDSFCSSVSSMKSDDTAGSTKIAKSRLVKPSTTAATATG